MTDGPEVRRLVVPDFLWPRLVRWLGHVGFMAAPSEVEDGVETFVVAPNPDTLQRIRSLGP